MLLIYKRAVILLTLCLVLHSCKGGNEAKGEDEVKSTQTPVTVTSVVNGPLTEYIELNATSVFLQKNYIKANAAGYIQAMNIQIGKYVTAGQLLFTIKTKESQSIGNTISNLDPSFKFSGVNKIVASAGGYITQLSHQSGDYVQDGEQLAIISDKNSFAFILNLPYELHSYADGSKSVEVILPDSTKLSGTITGTMPTVDSLSQTQGYIVKINAGTSIPENLVAKVRIIKARKDNVQSLPKAAILTNDAQSDFWVMKMTDSVTAVKVNIQKGIETKDMVEVLSPAFSLSDRILVTGNYGLPDTANVKVTKE